MTIRRAILTTSCCVLAFYLIAGPSASLSDAKNLETVARNDVKKPAMIAVWARADWCGACSKLGKVYGKLEARTAKLPVLHLRMNRTDKSTNRQAEYLAAVLGIEKIWRTNAAEVGTIALIDAETRKLVATARASDGIDRIEKTIRKALKRAGG